MKVLSISQHTKQSSPLVPLRGCRIALTALFSIVFSTSLLAQQVIKVTQSAWANLTSGEQALIQQKNIVDLVEAKSFGTIIDNQGVDESTAGTSGGAQLGGAIASAAYIDNALKGGNYSFKGQLAIGLLGALLGSTLDSKPNAQYHFRYAVRLGSGDVAYFDETKGDPFRHPVGVCVSVPYIALIDQQLCTQTPTTLRASYMPKSVLPVYEVSQSNAATVMERTGIQVSSSETSVPILVSCKLGTLAPVRTSAEKCELIKGSQVQ